MVEDRCDSAQSPLLGTAVFIALQAVPAIIAIWLLARPLTVGHLARGHSGRPVRSDSAPYGLGRFGSYAVPVAGHTAQRHANAAPPSTQV